MEGIDGKMSKNASNRKAKSEVDSSPVRPKSSPNSLGKFFTSPGKIPRLRPKTANPSAFLNDSGPKVEQSKIKRNLVDRHLTGRTTVSFLPKKVIKESTAKENSTVKTREVKFNRKNGNCGNPGDFQLGNRNDCDSTKESANSEVNSIVHESRLAGANTSFKLKDLNRKIREIPRIHSDSIHSGHSSKRSSQDFQKGIQVNETKKQKKRNGISEAIKEALNEDFASLLPLYQTEMKKITDVWVTTIYSSLTMRSHLVKLLVDAYPNINMGQFQTEDDRLLKCIGQAKTNTERETENLFQFIKSLAKSQMSAKEENESIMREIEIAKTYSNDWSLVTKKLADLSEETKKLQSAIPEEQRKKEVHEKKLKEKILDTESILLKKEKEIQKLMNQLSILERKESAFRGRMASKLENLNDIKANIESMKKTEQQYKKLKSMYLGQNDTFRKKIDGTGCFLEEKKALGKQKGVKNQMQVILEQIQPQRHRVPKSSKNEHVNNTPGQTVRYKEKTREQLWIDAVKLILRGFWAQMEKLEFDKNKLLLELQTNDVENIKNIEVTIPKKEHSVRTIVNQMMSFQKSSNNLGEDSYETPIV